MYEGTTPDDPGPKDRFWDIIERYGVTQLYTAPTAIRTFMKWGAEEPETPRPLVAAGARLGRRAHQPRGVDVVPHPHRRRALPDRRHVVADRDRGHMISPLPGVTTTKPGSATFPLPGDLRRDRRRRRATGSSGAAATSPSPSRGRRCCAASGATPSATGRPTGAASRAATSPATAPRSTRTATSGCSAGSTT